MSYVHKSHILPALGTPATLTNQTSLLVNQSTRIAAFGAFAVNGCGAVFDIFFQGALYAGFPGVEGITLEVEVFDEVNHVRDGHAVAQHAADELGVVPEFFLK